MQVGMIKVAEFHRHTLIQAHDKVKLTILTTSVLILELIITMTMFPYCRNLKK